MHADHWQPPPGHPLHPYVLWIFRFRAQGGYRSETILPKGNVDILFNLGETARVRGERLGGGDVCWAGPQVAGVQTRAVVVMPQGEVDVLGVSLRAESAAALLPLPLHEVTDRPVEGALVYPGLDDVAGRLRRARTFPRQCALLARWLVDRLRPPADAGAVRRACALLRGDGGEDAVARAAKGVGISPRHLRRLFAEQVGLSPAAWLRLARFVDALQRTAAPGPTLTQVAHAAGYFDQPHFCRDFRAFAGMTPQEYRLRARGPAVGHIFSP